MKKIILILLICFCNFIYSSEKSASDTDSSLSSGERSSQENDNNNINATTRTVRTFSADYSEAMFFNNYETIFYNRIGSKWYKQYFEDKISQKNFRIIITFFKNMIDVLKNSRISKDEYSKHVEECIAQFPDNEKDNAKEVLLSALTTFNFFEEINFYIKTIEAKEALILRSRIVIFDGGF